ncbi:hypothetical protein E2C01_074340 [Portunus trituberculatus]|uniref:Uncharacterized protein n=1 Tax=Portunus trituberculatus TaxID=210409 RepID=A0A5B7IGU0_PORTR|nr:hypothetical protein [Portunus trituberculatus]
MVRPLAGSPPL